MSDVVFAGFLCSVFGGMEDFEFFLCQNRLCTDCISRTRLFALLSFGLLGYFIKSQLE
jgi:hypothetical protein